MKGKNKIDILALAYHQLKTHTIAIRGYSELLLKQVSGPLTIKQSWYLINIMNHTTEMFAAIDNFLKASRLEGGQLFLRPEPVQPEDLIEDVIDKISFLARARNALIVFERPAKKFSEIKADPVILKQVLINLIYNSCKYHHGMAKIIVSIRKQNKNLVFSIKDDGIGIPEDEKKKIFTKFFRGREARLIDTKGSGLGLYVSKAMIKASGGDIHFKSQINKGSTFWFTIPIK